MTANYRKSEPMTEGLYEDPEHDALYSSREKQREHLSAKGYDDDEIEEILSDDEEDEEGNEYLKAEPSDYEKADDALLEAHEKVVQWKADESSPDLTKAPGVWNSQNQVPDFVLEKLEELINSSDVVWSGNYERLPPGAEAAIKKVLEERMTQPQGWSLESLYNDLSDVYPDQDEEYLVGILRNETSAVLNTAREEAYKERADSDEYVYDWIGPNDWRTTDTCLAIEERIEDEGGAVSMERLKEILLEEAQAHADAEGTPDRVDDFQPHWQCRRTFTRRVQTI